MSVYSVTFVLASYMAPFIVETELVSAESKGEAIGLAFLSKLDLMKKHHVIQVEAVDVTEKVLSITTDTNVKPLKISEPLDLAGCEIPNAPIVAQIPVHNIKFKGLNV